MKYAFGNNGQHTEMNALHENDKYLTIFTLPYINNQPL